MGKVVVYYVEVEGVAYLASGGTMGVALQKVAGFIAINRRDVEKSLRRTAYRAITVKVRLADPAEIKAGREAYEQGKSERGVIVLSAPKPEPTRQEPLPEGNP